MATVVVTLLLTFGVVSFILPELRGDLGWSELPHAVRGLVAVVLLFDIYAIYQQLQIHYVRRKLLEREELFRLINENVADMIAVVGADGRRIYNSLSYQKVLGYSLAELQGSSSSLDQIHPEDRALVAQAAQVARKTGIGKTIEYRIRHKDGTWRVFESRASGIRGATGAFEKLVIVNRDITGRLQALQALQRSESDFRSIVEDAPYGIFRSDAEGNLLRVNPALCNMLGYATPDELVGKNLEKAVFRKAAEFKRVNELLAGTNELKDVEAEWTKKDGAPLAVRCCGRKGESGSARYYEVFVEDITEKRILEAQVRMSAKMEAVGRLSGGIAHDFNNLLGVIIGYAAVLKRRLGAGNPLYEHAEEIEKAGERAASLTRQLLAFSRQQILSPTVLDLTALVKDMEKMLPRLIGEDIAVSTNLGEAIGMVKADRGQIEQILMNLAVNARDAMPEGGKLVIETANQEFDAQYVRQHAGAKLGHYVMLSVTDSGMGMDAETQAHIFEPFFTTKELGKGTGLGLATVYGVVKQSGGYIWVDSAVGEGASFKVFLPRTMEETSQIERGPDNVESVTRTETVLLAEDSEPLRRLAKSFLESHGFTVLSAEDGAEAVRIAENYVGRIHLLVTDVIMPGIRTGAGRAATGERPRDENFVYVGLHGFFYSRPRRFG